MAVSRKRILSDGDRSQLLGTPGSEVDGRGGATREQDCSIRERGIRRSDGEFPGIGGSARHTGNEDALLECESSGAPPTADQTEDVVEPRESSSRRLGEVPRAVEWRDGCRTVPSRRAEH